MKRINVIFFITVILLVWSCNETTIKKSESVNIDIELLQKDTNSVKVLFKPEVGTSYYEYAIGKESDFANFENGTMDGIETIEGGEPEEVVFPSLFPNTIYAIYAKAYSKDGQSAGINVYKFSTKDARFRVESYYVMDDAAGFKLIFTNEYSSCRYYLGKSSDKENFINGTLECDVVSDIDEYYAVNYFNLNPDEEYVFFAIGKDRLGIETELFEVPIKTYATGECASMTLETDIDIYSGIYNMIPNDKCGKIVGCVLLDGVTTGYFSSWHNDPFAMFQAWEKSNWNGTSSAWNGETLKMNFITNTLLNENPIDVYAVIYDKDLVPVGIKFFEVKTPALNTSLEKPNPVAIEVSNITSSGATYKFSADKTVFGYMYETVEADWYDDFKENSSEWYETYLHDKFFSNGKYFHYGNESFVWTEKTGQTNFRYYAASAPMNANGPRAEGWGPITLVSYTTNK